MNSIIDFFEYEHLPPHLQEVSKPICELAKKLIEDLPAASEVPMEEIRVGLRKLLEAKDCFVRAKLSK